MLERTTRIATEFLDGLPERPVVARRDAAAMIEALDRPLPDAPAEPTGSSSSSATQRVATCSIAAAAGIPSPMVAF